LSTWGGSKLFGEVEQTAYTSYRLCSRSGSSRKIYDTAYTTDRRCGGASTPSKAFGTADTCYNRRDTISHTENAKHQAKAHTNDEDDEAERSATYPGWSSCDTGVVLVAIFTVVENLPRCSCTVAGLLSFMILYVFMSAGM
jgi:hypothetical protein